MSTMPFQVLRPTHHLSDKKGAPDRWLIMAVVVREAIASKVRLSHGRQHASRAAQSSPALNRMSVRFRGKVFPSATKLD